MYVLVTIHKHKGVSAGTQHPKIAVGAEQVLKCWRHPTCTYPLAFDNHYEIFSIEDCEKHNYLFDMK